MVSVVVDGAWSLSVVYARVWAAASKTFAWLRCAAWTGFPRHFCAHGPLLASYGRLSNVGDVGLALSSLQAQNNRCSASRRHWRAHQ